ncbi:amidohydrolase [Leucobacter allii]|uniref:Amidohydrolase n=1 Tax=Leucobacter allii TaxID=2932247 RepID=A0ABY4FKN7_9MICO|nr:amidohydrolase [Leucobacter allii]UOQ56834.1 amidohydrolase [Leucobacter allii]
MTPGATPTPASTPASIAGAIPDPPTGAGAGAETIFLGGPIVTMDAERSTAEALAVAAGRIVAVGEAEAVLAHRGPATEVVDLAGRALLPGFVEAHGHPMIGMSFRGDGVIDVRAAICPTAESVLRTVRAAVAAAPVGMPLTVVGWEELLRPGLPEPHRAWLDALAPRNPLAVLHNSAHSAWANSLALAAAGVDAATPDPEGSHFVRDALGEPTGRAEELPATLMLAGAPLDVAPERAPALLAAELAAYAAAGVTTVGELALDPAQGALLAGVTASEGRVRVRAYRMSNRPRAVASGVGSAVPADPEMYREIGVKLWADGSPWVGTIAASFPYADTETARRLGVAGARGCCNYTAAEVEALCAAGLRAGEQVAVHAQGDAALDLVLDAVAAALEGAIAAGVDVGDHRIRLEHCCLMTPEQFRRAADLGLTCSLFLAHVRYWGDAIGELFGERGERWTAARSALDAGLRISLHNDVPVTPSEPLANVHAAVTRRTRSGRVLAPEERISVEEALAAVTIDAAWQLRSERELGSLEPGKHADLVELTDDPRAVDPEAIDGIGVVRTWLAGRPVGARGA